MKPSSGGIQGLIEKAAPTLAATAGEEEGGMRREEVREGRREKRKEALGQRGGARETRLAIVLLSDSVAAISKAVEIPTMAASGISAITAPLAIAAGASGVGVGSAVNKLNSEIAMLAAVREVRKLAKRERR